MLSFGQVHSRAPRLVMQQVVEREAQEELQALYRGARLSDPCARQPWCFSDNAREECTQPLGETCHLLPVPGSSWAPLSNTTYNLAGGKRAMLRKGAAQAHRSGHQHRRLKQRARSKP